EPYSADEFKAFFDTVRNMVDLESYQRQTALALLTLLQATSLSLSELSGLEWEDFDAVRKGFNVRRGRVQDSKGWETSRLKTRYRERFQPLPEWAFLTILNFKATTEGTGFVFRGANRNPLNVKYFVKSVLSKLPGWRGFHAARHSFATDLASSGVAK